MLSIFYDGMHVTDRGSLVYAEYIAERLYDEVLARRLKGRKDEIFSLGFRLAGISYPNFRTWDE